VVWGGNIFGSLKAAFATPAWLDTLERHCWLDLWRAPVIDAIDELGIETRRYGPVQVNAIAEMPEEPMFNLVLNAALPSAVGGGHLGRALEWVESLGIDCRVPIDPRHAEADAAEEVLNQRGYRRTEAMVRFVRDTSQPDFPMPPGTRVEQIEECTEGFAHVLGDGFELGMMSHCFFDCLPERHHWRCYWATDEDGFVFGAGTMMVHFEIAQLVFAAVREQDLGRGGHMALLHQRILDAAAARCHTVFADTREPYGDPDSPSLAARNLVRAGFKQHSVRQVWRLS
jgi:hypothetical protein